QLADQMVEPHDAVAPQQPALQMEEDLADLYPMDEAEEATQNNSESFTENKPDTASKVAAKPAVEPTEKKVTKRRNAPSKK
ncbi:EcsC family protein, partial [bacterium LRH843]|nr:EcsC family protein [bacterium LRH843]